MSYVGGLKLSPLPTGKPPPVEHELLCQIRRHLAVDRTREAAILAFCLVDPEEKKMWQLRCVVADIRQGRLPEAKYGLDGVPSGIERDEVICLWIQSYLKTLPPEQLRHYSNMNSCAIQQPVVHRMLKSLHDPSILVSTLSSTVTHYLSLSLDNDLWT